MNWKKVSTEINVGDSKAIHTDKTPQLTVGLNAFCPRARSLRHPVPIMTETISIQANHLPYRLIKEYKTPLMCITPTEADTLKKLEFSQKWAFSWL